MWHLHALAWLNQVLFIKKNMWGKWFHLYRFTGYKCDSLLLRLRHHFMADIFSVVYLFHFITSGRMTPKCAEQREETKCAEGMETFILGSWLDVALIKVKYRTRWPNYQGRKCYKKHKHISQHDIINTVRTHWCCNNVNSLLYIKKSCLCISSHSLLFPDCLVKCKWKTSL